MKRLILGGLAAFAIGLTGCSSTAPASTHRLLSPLPQLSQHERTHAPTRLDSRRSIPSRQDRPRVSPGPVSRRRPRTTRSALTVPPRSLWRPARALR